MLLVWPSSYRKHSTSLLYLTSVWVFRCYFTATTPLRHFLHFTWEHKPQQTRRLTDEGLISTGQNQWSVLDVTFKAFQSKTWFLFLFLQFNICASLCGMMWSLTLTDCHTFKAQIVSLVNEIWTSQTVWKPNSGPVSVSVQSVSLFTVCFVGCFIVICLKLCRLATN